MMFPIYLTQCFLQSTILNPQPRLLFSPVSHLIITGTPRIVFTISQLQPGPGSQTGREKQINNQPGPHQPRQTETSEKCGD